MTMPLNQRLSLYRSTAHDYPTESKTAPTWSGGVPVLRAGPAAGPGVLGEIAGVGVHQVLAVLVPVAIFTA